MEKTKARKRAKVKEWLGINKRLERMSTTTIDEEIRKAEIALSNLLEEKRRGTTHKKHYNQFKEIEGIPIVYNGKYKIALSESKPNNSVKYKRHFAVIYHWLRRNEYDPQLKCTTIKTEHGECE